MSVTTDFLAVLPTGQTEAEAGSQVASPAVHHRAAFGGTGQVGRVDSRSRGVNRKALGKIKQNRECDELSTVPSTQ